MVSEKYSIGWLSIELRMPIALLLGVVALALIAVFVFQPEIRTHLTFVASIMAGTALLYSAYYAGASASRRYKRDAQRDTLQLIREFDDFRLIQARRQLDEFDHRGIAPADVAEEIKDNEELHNAVRAILNLFEDISIAIQRGYADEEMVYDSLRTLVPYLCEVLRPYIQDEQQRYDDTTLYQEILMLANTWENGNYLSTGEDIDIRQKEQNG